MADGWLPVAANASLDALVAAYPWIKLHTGSPGAAGTSNPATEATRKQPTYAAAAAGSVATSSTITWTNVAASETYSHFTGNTLATLGAPGYSGGVTANPVTAGDTFSIASGSLTVSETLAS